MTEKQDDILELLGRADNELVLCFNCLHLALIRAAAFNVRECIIERRVFEIMPYGIRNHSHFDKSQMDHPDYFDGVCDSCKSTVHGPLFEVKAFCQQAVQSEEGAKKYSESGSLFSIPWSDKEPLKKFIEYLY